MSHNWRTTAAATATVAMTAALVCWLASNPTAKEVEQDSVGSDEAVASAIQAQEVAPPPPAAIPSGSRGNRARIPLRVGAGTTAGSGQPTGQELRTRVLNLTDNYSEGATADFFALMDEWRQNGPWVSERLVDELESMSDAEKFGHVGQRLVLVLGYLGEPSSIGPLRDLVYLPLPTPDPDDHGLGLRTDAVVAQSMSIVSMERIVNRDGSPHVIGEFREILSQILATPEASTSVKVYALRMIMKHTRDRDAAKREVAQLLPPEQQYLLDIEFKPLQAGTTR